MYSLTSAGIECFDIWSRKGAYAGLIAKKKSGYVLYWNGNATRGSKRVFATINDALEFMHQRRVKKGWVKEAR